MRSAPVQLVAQNPQTHFRSFDPQSLKEAWSGLFAQVTVPATLTWQAKTGSKGANLQVVEPLQVSAGTGLMRITVRMNSEAEGTLDSFS
jgi:hypothetical protein